MTTNPCAPESCLAAPRSAHLLTKSLVHKQLGCTRQGEGGELKTREREEKIRTQTTPRLEPTAQRPQPTTRLFGTEATLGARAILNIKYDPFGSVYAAIPPRAPGIPAARFTADSQTGEINRY